MFLLDFFSQDSVLIVHKPLLKILDNDHLSAIFFSQCLYWAKIKFSKEGHYRFYKKNEDWYAELGFTRKIMRRVMQALKDKNLISTTFKKVNGTPVLHYDINFEVLSNLIRDHFSITLLLPNPPQNHPQNPPSDMAQKATSEVAERATSTWPKGPPPLIDKDYIQRLHKEKIKKESLSELEIPEFLDRELWEDWIEHRSEIRKPLTVLAAKRFLTKLTTLKEAKNDPKEVISESIMNGWSGIYPLNANKSPSLSFKERDRQYEEDRAKRIREIELRVQEEMRLKWEEEDRRKS